MLFNNLYYTIVQQIGYNPAMPFIEHGGRPEWTNRYPNQCVVLTLESMLSAVTGHHLVAPEAVYKLRKSQIGNAFRSLKADIDRTYPYLSSFLKGDLAGRGNAIRTYRYKLVAEDRGLITNAILPTWMEFDPELSRIITKLQFHFVNEPYSELEKAAKNRYPVGIAVASLGMIPGITTHMFHLASLPGTQRYHDASDRIDFIQKAINNSITDGSLSQVVEITRKECGLSALIITG